MRSRLLSLLFLLFLLPSISAGQEDTRRDQVVPLAEGGFVAFKSETAWAGRARTSNVQELNGVFRSQAFADEKHLIHRVLVDAAGKYIFGYDLLIQPLAAAKTFTITVKPLDLEIETRLLKSSPEIQPARIATLPQSAAPQVLVDGDSFALDLLVNRKTGVKIVDFVKVSFDRSKLWEDDPRIVPRDFTLDAVALSVADFRLLIDGNLMASGKPGTIFGGALIWCYVEGRGRFIFSLVPREGYQFQKVGIIKENKIEFTVKGQHYEWLSNSPILPSGGTWNVWVLHDPNYVPFGLQDTAKKEKNKLDKLDDSIRAANNRAARIRDSAGATFETEGAQGRQAPASNRVKVMVGAADRIENLVPRNP
ncbi:MAG TPA: hypothetical protein VHR36_00545 [Pyrinomonadaceae bacterium]|nr:hypothetical protein [Pyrinomonadaceae bacterium]